jgi:very-short-patch-repair endonuclease
MRSNDVNEPREDRPARSSRVLVAVMNNQRDLHIARDQGWYRIPYQRAPARVGADYLAFYHTKAFPEERWSVCYYTPVRRYRVLSRRSLLPDEPAHPRADALYYKIEIGALRRLPRPIPSHRLRRITFIPTTLERLLEAEEINDLWCGGAEEEELWQVFKDNGISAERRYSLREDEEGYTIDFAILCRQGKIAIFLEGEQLVQNVRVVREHRPIDEYELAAQGWSVLRLDTRSLARSSAACLVRVRDAIERQGGVLPPEPNL